MKTITLLMLALSSHSAFACFERSEKSYDYERAKAMFLASTTEGSFDVSEGYYRGQCFTESGKAPYRWYIGIHNATDESPWIAIKAIYGCADGAGFMQNDFVTTAKMRDEKALWGSLKLPDSTLMVYSVSFRNALILGKITQIEAGVSSSAYCVFDELQTGEAWLGSKPTLYRQ